MKYVKKMLLVPLGRDNPAEIKASELDLELNKILRKKKINQEDKIKHYNQVLSRFLAMNENIKTQKSQNIDIEQQMEPLKRKLSEYVINESKKMKKSETFDENPEEYDYDDDYLSVDNHSQGTTKQLSLDDMDQLNNSVMQKSPSFDLVKEDNKELNRFLKKNRNNQMKFGDKKVDLIKKYLNWTSY
jgi:hypothetical protein